MHNMTGKHNMSISRGLYVVIVAALLIAAAISAHLWASSGNAQASTSWIAPSTGEVRKRGKQLYDQFCASCHGVNLQGQFNWRQRLPNGRLPAPPHDVSGHTWHHPDWQLRSMIKDGFVPGVTAPEGYQSDMPAFGSVLTDEQIDLIIGYIKSSWPEQALDAQKTISLKPRTQH